MPQFVRPKQVKLLDDVDTVQNGTAVNWPGGRLSAVMRATGGGISVQFKDPDNVWNTIIGLDNVTVRGLQPDVYVPAGAIRGKTLGMPAGVTVWAILVTD